MSEIIKQLPRKKLEALIKSFELISSPLNPQEILKLVLQEVSKLLDADAASIFLINEKKQELELKVATNLTEEEIQKIKVPIGKGIAGFVAEKNQLVNIKDVKKDKRFYPNIDSITGFISKNILTAPLKTQEKVIGVIQLLNKKNNYYFTREDEILLTEFSRLVGVTLEKAWLYNQLLEKQSLETDLKIASTIQDNLIPKKPLENEKIFIKGFYKPAKYISGDYFDYFQISKNKILLVLGDVAGKGAQASLIMASTKAFLSAAIEAKMDFIAMVNKLNKFLALNTPADKFLTVFLGIIDLSVNKITYINSGHESGIILTENGEKIELKSNNIVMGVLEDFELIPSEIDFSPDSFLFIYTDGITEAANNSMERFGNERLLEILYMNQDNPINLFEIIPREIEIFSEDREQLDDITFVLAIRK